MPHAYRPSRNRPNNDNHQASPHQHHPPSSNTTLTPDNNTTTPNRPRKQTNRSPAQTRHTPSRRHPSNQHSHSHIDPHNVDHMSPQPHHQRIQSNSHRQVQYVEPEPNHDYQYQSQSQSPAQPTQATMSPSSRLAWNLKVLQRHDPSITTIVHQVSYAVLYRYNFDRLPTEDGSPGELIGWEKIGVEGSMFVYERNGTPSYGFFILNRNGIGNFIQTMGKNDDLEITDNEDYIIWRSPSPPPPPGSDEPLSKGICVGLWIFEPMARKRLAEYMTKLHEHIKSLPSPSSSRSVSPSRSPSVSASASASNSDPFSPSNGTTDAVPYSSPSLSSTSSEAFPIRADDTISESGLSTQSELDNLFSRIRMPGQQLSVGNNSTSHSNNVSGSPTPFGSKTVTASTIPLPSVPGAAAPPSDFSDRSSSVSSLGHHTARNEERGRALLDTLFQPEKPHIADDGDDIVLHQSHHQHQPYPQHRSTPPVGAPLAPAPSGNVLNGGVLTALLGLLPGPGSEPYPRSNSLPMGGPPPRTPSPTRRATITQHTANFYDTPHDIPVPHLNANVQPQPPQQRPYSPQPQYPLPQSTSSVFDLATPNHVQTTFPTERELVPYEMSPLPPSPSRLPAPTHDWNPRAHGGGSGKKGQGSRQRKKNGVRARTRGKGREDLFGPLEGGDDYDEHDQQHHHDADPISNGHSQNHSNSHGHSGYTGTPAKGARKKEQYTPQNGTDGGDGDAKVGREDAKQVLVNGYVKVAGANGGAPPELSRNDFVREVLTLIHTDSSFADELYSAYLKKTRRVRT